MTATPSPQPPQHRSSRVVSDAASKPRGGSSWAFGVALAVATGAAFAGGAFLREQPPPVGRIAPGLRVAAPARFAQAGGADAAPFTNERRAFGGDSSGQGSVADDGADDEKDGVKTFEDVYNLVKEHYVDALPTDTKMSRGAVRAMILSLNDPNSVFLEPEQRAVYEREASGMFAGIGAALYVDSRKRDGFTERKIVVQDALPGSPAEKAGLRTGDVITHIDGKWILGADPLLDYNRVMKKFEARDATEDEVQRAADAAQERIKGGLGLFAAQMQLRQGKDEPRTLTVERATSPRPLKIRLTTAETDVATVSGVRPNSARGAGDGAYIAVRALTEKTGDAFAGALAELPASGTLTLDLRDNPGGSLEAAEEIDRLLTGAKSGAFAIEIGAHGKRTPLVTAQSNAPATSASRTVTVLVNRGTAGVAEALAASLADKGVATLAGGRTFGDASSQTLYPLADGSAFTLTTGKLTSPKGTSWAVTGLLPKRVATRGLSR